MKIAIVDTYYPDFLRSVPTPKSYQRGLDDVLDMFFGTHRGYSTALRGLGHEVIDIIGNHAGLQILWGLENDHVGTLPYLALEQIAKFKPDVVFMQDLSFFSVPDLRDLADKYILAGQCSCAIDDEKVKPFDVLFTSLPHYVDRFQNLGVKAVFLPLAFDPIVIERVPVASQRTHVSFVGGYGRHWETDELFTVLAERTPIQFWGYGFENAPKVIRDRWRGPAWGRQMYEIYLRSHIVVNRHGGVSEGYANNLRMFEATGCGALLLTEFASNLDRYFSREECVSYLSPRDAAVWINQLLETPKDMQHVAAAGQQRTLSKHTYAQRMPIVANALAECLDRKKVSA